MRSIHLGKIILPFIFLAFLTMQSYSAITLVEPTDNQTCVNLNPYFDWNSIINVDHYNIVLSLSSVFNPDSTWISDDLISTEAYALGTFNVSLLPSTTYYWKVRAVLLSGGKDSSVTRTFTTTTDYTIPKSPVSTSCVPLLSTFTVETYLQAVDSLRIIISTNRNFSTHAIDTVIAKPTIANGMMTTQIQLKNTGTYYWTAFQYANGCWSDSISGIEFKFTTVQNGPSLAFPENNAKGGSIFESGPPFNTNLYWHPIPNAFYYIIRVSDTQDFGVYTEYQTTDTTILANFGKTNNTSHYWMVAAKLPPFDEIDTCQTLFSEIRTLKTPYVAPVLTQPQNDDKCIPINVNLMWDSVFNAIYYRVQVATSKNFENNSIVIDIDSIASPEQVVTLPSSMTQYYWRVRVDNASNSGLWSTPFTFQSAVITPSPIYPEPNSVSVPLNVHFQWTQGIEGTTYTFQLSDTSSMSKLLLDTLLNTNYCDFTFTTFFKNYYWRVKAHNQDCESTWSEVFSFKTQIDAPFGLVPPNDSTGIEPTLVKLSWKAPAGALKYDLDLALDTGFTQMFRFERNITALNVLYDNLSETTDYYWRVRAKNLEGESKWTTTHHFKTGYIRPQVPTLIYPTNGSNKVPIDVELKWSASNRAQSYHLQFASDANFQNLIVDSLGIDTTVCSIQGLDNNRMYYWRVEALNIQGSSGYSTIFSFQTIPLPPVGKVQLVFPDSGAIKQKTTLEFKWDTIPNVLGYRLQIATDEEFTNLVQSFDKVWTNSKLVYNLPEKTLLYWRVRGWNDGGESEWSDVWSFTTEDISSVPITHYFNTTIYPSPIKDKLNIQLFLENSSVVQFQFIDLQGKLLKDINLGMKNTGENAFEIDVSNLPAGMYIYKIIADGKEEIGKMIKQ